MHAKTHLKSNIWKSLNHILLAKISLGDQGLCKEKNPNFQWILPRMWYSKVFQSWLKLSEQNGNWLKILIGRALKSHMKECHLLNCIMKMSFMRVPSLTQQYENALLLVRSVLKTICSTVVTDLHWPSTHTFAPQGLEQITSLGRSKV